MSRLLLAGAVLLAAVSPSASEEAGKVESIGALTAPASDSVKAALEPEGYKAILSDGTVACEIWFRKGMPGLVEASLVGVISLPEEGSDFRGQTVKPGAYTLRYARLPSDGNHMGAAPTSDFLLMIPLAEDRNATAIPGRKELMTMSTKASGTNHPAVLNLTRVGDREEFPAVAANHEGHEVFYAKVTTPTGELAIGLVVKGVAE